MTGLEYQVSGVLLALSTRLVGLWLAQRWPCRFVFWTRIVMGVPCYLLSAGLIYVGCGVQ